MNFCKVLIDGREVANIGAAEAHGSMHQALTMYDAFTPLFCYHTVNHKSLDAAMQAACPFWIRLEKAA